MARILLCAYSASSAVALRCRDDLVAAGQTVTVINWDNVASEDPADYDIVVFGGANHFTNPVTNTNADEARALGLPMWVWGYGSSDMKSISEALGLCDSGSSWVQSGAINFEDSYRVPAADSEFDSEDMSHGSDHAIWDAVVDLTTSFPDVQVRASSGGGDYWASFKFSDGSGNYFDKIAGGKASIIAAVSSASGADSYAALSAFDIGTSAFRGTATFGQRMVMDSLLWRDVVAKAADFDDFVGNVVDWLVTGGAEFTCSVEPGVLDATFTLTVTDPSQVVTLTEIQVVADGGDFDAGPLIVDMEVSSPDDMLVVVTPSALEENTSYDARVRMTLDGTATDWRRCDFTTVLNFNFGLGGDWALIGNLDDPVRNTDRWGRVSGPNNVLKIRPAGSIYEGTIGLPYFEGRVSEHPNFTVPSSEHYPYQIPAALVDVTSASGGAEEVDITTYHAVGGSEAGFVWERMYEHEFNRTGPIYAAGTVEEDTETQDFYGIMGFVQTATVWPANFACIPQASVSEGDSHLYKYSYTEVSLFIEQFHDGVRRRLLGPFDAAVPPLRTYSRHCQQALGMPWWTCRMKITRPNGALDPEVRVQLGFKVGRTTIEDGEFQVDETFDYLDENSSPAAMGCGFPGIGYKSLAGNSQGQGLFGWSVLLPPDITIDTVGSCALTTPGEIDPPEEEPPGIPLEPEAGELVPCPPEAFNDGLLLFLGSKDGDDIFQYGIQAEENEPPQQTLVTMQVTTNPLAPNGVGGEAVFKDLYIAYTHAGQVALGVTPIVDGEIIPEMTWSWVDEPTTDGLAEHVKKEISLFRGYEDSGAVERMRNYLRGTWFQALITAYDVCGSGFTLDGVILDYDLARETQPGINYLTGMLKNHGRTQLDYLYVGRSGGSDIYQALQATTDDGAPIQARGRTNPIAPAGPGGEAAFQVLRVAVTRTNLNDVDLSIRPFVDSVAGTEQTQTLAGTTDPVYEVLEFDIREPFLGIVADGFESGFGGHYAGFAYAGSPIGEDPVTLEELTRYELRGCWIEVEVKTVTELPDGDLWIDGIDVEYQVSREQQEGANVTSGYDS